MSCSFIKNNFFLLYLHWEFWSCFCLSSIDFSTNSKQDALSHWIAHEYSHAHYNGLCNHLRDFPWEDNFKLSASVAANKFSEWVQVGIVVCVPHYKYQVKPHSSLWFSASCAPAIVHRNHFFCLCQQNKSSESKVQTGK